MVVMNDPYATLKVGRDASPEEIKSAYRKASRTAHPDKGGSDEAMAEVTGAWALLSDPESRAHYDATGEAPAEAPLSPPEEALFLRALSQALMDPAGPSDLLRGIKNRLTTDLDSARREYDAGQEALTSYRALLGRFERTDEEPNLIESTIKSSADKIEDAVKDLLSKISVLKAALEIEDHYRDTRMPEEDFKEMLYGHRISKPDSYRDYFPKEFR